MAQNHHNGTNPDDSTTDGIRQQIRTTERWIDWMNEEYSGCDWCCGGGDEQMATAQQELSRLEELISSGYRHAVEYTAAV